MSAETSKKSIICFGQQPCGFFPKRFLIAKIITARRLQASIGGEIVFFYHDSDHDPRETKTILRHPTSNFPITFNFEFRNKVQQKYSPLYTKKVDPDWQRKTSLQLPGLIESHWIDVFSQIKSETVSSFCLEMYQQMGWLEGIRVVRSSDPEFRRAACEIQKYFVDVPYEGETVRARFFDGNLTLHKGGDAFISLPRTEFNKEQISPARESRLVWMQSVLNCTHYISGAGEQAYLNKEEAPEITFISRDPIDRSEEAHADSTI